VVKKPAVTLPPTKARPSTRPPPATEKDGLHPRNRHRARYDFARLVAASPELAEFIGPNPRGDQTIDFANPAAVTALNRALLKCDYGVAHWDIPPGYLCPPVPGRADYIHQVADLLAEGNAGTLPRGVGVAVLDIGVGANGIYPIIGVHEYGWRFVGTDIDPVALASARKIVAANRSLAAQVDLRLQRSPLDIFHGVVRRGERFAVTICNPPFHSSAAEAATGTQRKLRNLAGGQAVPDVRNFGGQSHELWCAGGELAFVRRMITQSADLPAETCGWFTTIVSKRENLPPLEKTLRLTGAREVRTIPMAQGQKKSRILAWRF
jgi:23S rRNA (adenine1618-N6)-methyltransferase